MAYLTKLANEDVAREINTVVRRLLLGYSEVTEKGRLISGIDFVRIVNEIIPKEVNSVLEGKEIYEGEN